MPQPLSTEARTFTAPSFYLTGRQPLSPGAILLAIVVAMGAVFAIAYAVGRSGHNRFASDGSGSMAAGGVSPGSSSSGDDDDDPSQVDTFVLGDPSEAPVPAHAGNHSSSVHPFLLVRLPRSGDHFGQIPDTSAGRLLYSWLAAFNQASSPALMRALPTAAPASAAASEMELRRQTGGFTLFSSREVEPGVIVFRLLDQTTPSTEVLGTLQMRPDSEPPAIASFSLRSVAMPDMNPPAEKESNPAARMSRR